MDTLDFSAPEIFHQPRATRVQEPWVLVVDDDAAFRELLVEFFWEAGYRVFDACDGADAFRHVDPRIDDDGIVSAIDLVVVDMSMPRMTGLQFLTHLRAWSLKTPVITMTAFPDSQFYKDSLAMGCVAAFPKPFSFLRLLDFIDELFDR